MPKTLDPAKAADSTTTADSTAAAASNTPVMATAGSAAAASATAASTTAPLVVDFDHVTMAYGPVTVAHDITLPLPAGGSVAIIGASGCGKSTVLKAILGAEENELTVLKGTVSYCGRDLATVGPDEMRLLRSTEIAFVPQDPQQALNAVRSVWAHAKEINSSWPKEMRMGKQQLRQRLLKMLSVVGLGSSTQDILKSRCYELSGGMAQRVCIALALLAKPRLILADEPTSAVDESAKQLIADALHAAQNQSGAALLLVTHDVDFARAMGCDVAVIDHGRIVERGPAADVLENPQSAHARLLKAASGLMDNLSLKSRNGYVNQAPLDPEAGRVDGAADTDTDTDGHEASCPCAHSNAPAETTVAAQGGPTEQDSHLSEGKLLCEVIDVHKRYRSLLKTGPEVLKGVSLKIYEGELLGLVGASGSGKSTLIRQIAALDKPDEGKVVFHECLHSPAETTSTTPMQRDIYIPCVQMVFQMPRASFNPARTIGWSVAEPLRHVPRGARVQRFARSEIPARVEELLKMVHLDPALARRYPHELSGGMLQRAAIARALAQNPEIIIADEATSALDSITQARIIELFTHLVRQKGIALIMISHNRELVEQVCTRTLLLENGRLSEPVPAA